jgi:hypothetical protein
MQDNQNSMPNQNSSQFNFGEFERKGSSFTWEVIYLKGVRRRGHTKPKGQAEPFAGNHYKLLKNAFDRLLIKCNYLKKIQRITVWRCTTDYDKNNIEFFTLYPAEFRLSVFLQSMTKEETEALRELLRGYYEAPAAIYGVSNTNDMSQLFSCKSTVNPDKSDQPQKVKTFEELNAEAKKIVFKNNGQYEDYVNSLPTYLTPHQKNGLLCNILENKANNKWLSKP